MYMTEHKSLVASNPASYLVGQWFKFEPRHQL